MEWRIGLRVVGDPPEMYIRKLNVATGQSEGELPGAPMEAGRVYHVERVYHCKECSAQWPAFTNVGLTWVPKEAISFSKNKKNVRCRWCKVGDASPAPTTQISTKQFIEDF